MDYIATSSVPIETSLTTMFEEQTREIKKFYVSPIRLLFDASLHITPCSFRSTLAATSRTQVIYQIIQQCNMSIQETLTFLGYGFLYNFQEYETRQKLYINFREEATSYLSQRGFRHFYKKMFFTAEQRKLSSN